MQDRVLENNIKDACRAFFDLQRNEIDLSGYLASLLIFQVIGENAKQLTQGYLSQNSEISKALKADVVGQDRGINFFREIRNDNAHMTSIPLDESYLQYLHSYIKSIYSCFGGEVTVDPKFSSSLQTIKAEYLKSDVAQPNFEIRKLIFLAKNIRESNGKILAQTFVSQTLGNLVDLLYENAENHIRPLLEYAKRKRHESAHNLVLPVNITYTPPLGLLEVHYGRLTIITEPSIEVASSSSSSSSSSKQLANNASKQKGKKAASTNIPDFYDLDNNAVYKKNSGVSEVLNFITKHDYANLDKREIDWLYPVRYILQSDALDKTVYTSMAPNHSLVLLRENANLASKAIKLPEVLYLNVFGVFCQTIFSTQLKATQKPICLKLMQQALNIADVNTMTISNDKIFETLLIASTNQKDYSTFKEIIALLLDHNADVNLASHIGMFPLFYAFHTRNNDLASLLINKGANFHDIKIITINEAGRKEAVGIATRFGIDAWCHSNPFSAGLTNGATVKSLASQEIPLCIPKNGDTTFLSSALAPLFIGNTAANLKNDAIKMLNWSKVSNATKQKHLSEIEEYFTAALSALHSMYQAIQKPDNYPLHFAVLMGRCSSSFTTQNSTISVSTQTPSAEVRLYNITYSKDTTYKLQEMSAEQLAKAMGRLGFYKEVERYYSKVLWSEEIWKEQQEEWKHQVDNMFSRTR